MFDKTRGKPPQPDCYFCAGTGEVTKARVVEINAGRSVPSAMVRPGRCLCTVSWAEVAEVLPGMITEIADRGR